MTLIPIYRRTDPVPIPRRDWVRTVWRALGLPWAASFGDAPGGPRHTFDRKGKGIVTFVGTIAAPSGSRLAVGRCGRLLDVPVAGGRVRLSAADACQQAGVGGCGLLWVGVGGTRSATPGRGS